MDYFKNYLQNNKDVTDAVISLSLNEAIERNLRLRDNQSFVNVTLLSNDVNNTSVVNNEIQMDDINLRSHKKLKNNDKQFQNLRKLEHIIDYTLNEKDSYCDKCYLVLEKNRGSILKNCLHTFCFDCLVEVIENTEQGRAILCPFRNTNVDCRKSILLRKTNIVTNPNCNTDNEIDPKQDSIFNHLAKEIENMKTSLALIQSNTPQIIEDYNQPIQKNNKNVKECEETEIRLTKELGNNVIIEKVHVDKNRNENRPLVNRLSEKNSEKLKDNEEIRKSDKNMHSYITWECEFCFNINLDSIICCLKCNKLKKDCTKRNMNDLSKVWNCQNCNYVNSNNIYVCEHCLKNGRNIGNYSFDNSYKEKTDVQPKIPKQNVIKIVKPNEMFTNSNLDKKLMSIFNEL